jgi:hypothetical protein
MVGLRIWIGSLSSDAKKNAEGAEGLINRFRLWASRCDFLGALSYEL